MNAGTNQRVSMAPYQQPVKEVLAAFQTDVTNGLKTADARTRLERYGRNELRRTSRCPRGAGSSRNSKTCSLSCSSWRRPSQRG